MAAFYAEDHLGSIRDLRMGDGQVLAAYDYDPYGNPTRVSETGGVRADYRYAGLFCHAQSGLYLTHYRVYDPVTARWISRDPIGEAGGINLYGYVGGNPVSFADPSGTCPLCGAVAGVAVVAGVTSGLATYGVTGDASAALQAAATGALAGAAATVVAAAASETYFGAIGAVLFDTAITAAGNSFDAAGVLQSMFQENQENQENRDCK